ncbi:MAG: hypothetical protein ACRC2T_17300 [Thermoguttaceae bacterium]
MSTLQFQAQISPDGFLAVPNPELFGKRVVVQISAESPIINNDATPNVDVKTEKEAGDYKPCSGDLLPNGKTPLQDFLDFTKGCIINLNDFPGEIEKNAIRDKRLKEKYGL